MSKVIYENPLSKEEDLKGFMLEGEADISISDGVMRMEGAASKEKEDGDGFVLWCPLTFPSDVRIDWEFRPLKEPGLAELFFAAKARSTGAGEIDAFHISYFRRRDEKDRAFHVCNLKKSYGDNLVAIGADPIPDATLDSAWYKLCVIKKSGHILFYINELPILEYRDDGISFGEILTGGGIGFRQLSPMIAEYKNLKVTWI